MREQPRLWRWLPDITQNMPRDTGSRHSETAEPVLLSEWPDDGSSWRDELLTLLKEMDPYRFEQLAQELLTAAGMENVAVTRRSNDAGIDGYGLCTLAGMLKVPAYFQCKRYGDRVGVKEIRDFRGALEGRSGLGLLVTTGQFTKAAQDEAARPGAVTITLVDGHRLCEYLKEFNLGVITTVRAVESVTVDRQWFSNL